jgi:hypothetical protein
VVDVVLCIWSRGVLFQEIFLKDVEITFPTLFIAMESKQASKQTVVVSKPMALSVGAGELVPPHGYGVHQHTTSTPQTN